MKFVLITFVLSFIAFSVKAKSLTQSSDKNAILVVDDFTRFNDHCFKQIKNEIPDAFEACIILGYDANEALVNSSKNPEGIETIKAFLVNGIDINVTNRSGYFTTLTYAAYIGRTEVVRFLLEQDGIKVNIAPKGGSTALIRASLSGELEIVRLLLATSGIDVNIRDDQGDTAMRAAIRNGYAEIVDMLRDSGAVE